MRDLLLGVILVFWVTMASEWLKRHNVASREDLMFYTVTAILLALLCWRGFLWLLWRFKPELFLRVNETAGSAKVDAALHERIAKRKAKRERGMNDASNNSKRTDHNKV